jgi:hypothetical protein
VPEGEAAQVMFFADLPWWAIHLWCAAWVVVIVLVSEGRLDDVRTSRALRPVTQVFAGFVVGSATVWLALKSTADALIAKAVGALRGRVA